MNGIRWQCKRKLPSRRTPGIVLWGQNASVVNRAHFGQTASAMDLPRRKAICLVLGPGLLFCTFLFPAPGELTPEAWRTAGVAAMMAVFWIGEAFPFAATALLPLVLFPLMGIADLPSTASPYANPVIFLFLGGIFIALAMERWHLHRRIALGILRWMGTRPSSIICGFLIASAFLSMWINNTATAVMMLPIGLSVIGLLQTTESLRRAGFAPALMLAIAYGANIGGMLTLIGTAPNAIFAGFVRDEYGYEVGFAQWMIFTIPFALLLLPLVLFILSKVCFRLPTDRIEGAGEQLRMETEKLGPISRSEILVALVFALTACFWLLRPMLNIPGLSDPVIAMAGGLSLFLLPAARGTEGGLLNWDTAKKIPWDVLLLIGGGLSLAGAIQGTGLANAIGNLAGSAGIPGGFVAIVLFAALMLLLTELTINTATTAALLPVMASVAVGLGENPILIGVVAALAASGAFMLPVATPPNAIVFAGGMVTVPQMIRAGLWANLGMILLLSLAASTYGRIIFAIP